MDGELYVDLATKSGAPFVQVSARGWAPAAVVPLRFFRPRSLLAMPLPVHGGTVEQLRPFVNVKSDDMFRLLVVWLVAALMGNMPVPVMVIQGIQGSAKSTLLRVIRMLVDPAKGVLRGQPRHEHDLAIAASKSWLVTYDNLSFIPDWLSDALCRIVTGGAFAARRLYSDGDEVIFEYRRPAVLNGIEELVTRSDLLDRGLVLNLQKIEETERRDEEEFWREFELAQPRILGALLDTIAGVLRELPNVVLPRKPRMADFARVGVAVETTLGWPPGSFMTAYTGNRAIANEIAIEASLFGPFIRILAARPGGWHGSPEALLRQLDQMSTAPRSGWRPWARRAPTTTLPGRAHPQAEEVASDRAAALREAPTDHPKPGRGRGRGRAREDPGRQLGQDHPDRPQGQPAEWSCRCAVAATVEPSACAHAPGRPLPCSRRRSSSPSWDGPVGTHRVAERATARRVAVQWQQRSAAAVSCQWRGSRCCRWNGQQDGVAHDGGDGGGEAERLVVDGLQAPPLRRPPLGPGGCALPLPPRRRARLHARGAARGRSR